MCAEEDFGKGEPAGPTGGVKYKVWQRCRLLTRKYFILDAGDYLWEEGKDVEKKEK